MDKTKIAIEIFDEFAKQYQDKFMDFELYQDTFDRFCQAVKIENAAILELACGPGNITRYLLQQRPDFRILATDLSTRMIELARKNIPEATFQILDCRDIHQLDRQFDGVMFGFGLPYLSKKDALQLIRKVSKLLNPNGVFYLSTMEDDYSKSGFKSPSSGGSKKMYIHYHQADYLTEELKKNGLEIIHLERKDYLEQDGEMTKDLILIARKQ